MSLSGAAIALCAALLIAVAGRFAHRHMIACRVAQRRRIESATRQALDAYLAGRTDAHAVARAADCDLELVSELVDEAHDQMPIGQTVRLEQLLYRLGRFAVEERRLACGTPAQRAAAASRLPRFGRKAFAPLARAAQTSDPELRRIASFSILEVAAKCHATDTACDLGLPNHSSYEAFRNALRGRSGDPEITQRVFERAALGVQTREKALAALAIAA